MENIQSKSAKAVVGLGLFLFTLGINFWLDPTTIFYNHAIALTTSTLTIESTRVSEGLVNAWAAHPACVLATLTVFTFLACLLLYALYYQRHSPHTVEYEFADSIIVPDEPCR